MSWNRFRNPPGRGAGRLGGALYRGLSGADPGGGAGSGRNGHGTRLDQGGNPPTNPDTVNPDAANPDTANPDTARLLDSRRKAAREAGAVEKLGQKLGQKLAGKTGEALPQTLLGRALAETRSGPAAPASAPRGKAKAAPAHRPSTKATPAQPPPSQARTVEGTLRGLMQDPRYWQPGRTEDAYRDGITRLFQAAWPGTAQGGEPSVDETGRPRRDTPPAIDVADLDALARSFLPQDRRAADQFRGEDPVGWTGPPTQNPAGRYYPFWIQTPQDRALYDIFTGRPPLPQRPKQPPFKVDPFDQDGPVDPTILNVASDSPPPSKPEPEPEPVPAPGPAPGPAPEQEDPAPSEGGHAGIGHNSGADAEIDAEGDAEAHQDEPGPYDRQEEESFEDYDWRIRKGLESRDLTEAELTAMREAYLKALEREDPDWRLHAQGFTREDLAHMSEVTDPGQVEAALRLWLENGGMFPSEAGARLAYVVDPQGRVFHIDHGRADPSLLGPNGVLSELQNRAFAARGREVAEHGDFSELLEFGLEAGMFTFAGSRQFATIAHAPAGGRTGGGRSGGGRSGGAATGRPHGDYFQDGTAGSDYKRFKHIQNRGYPEGFASREQANEVADGIRQQLADAEYTDVGIAVRGSAATGRAYSEQSGAYTGHRFDRGENGLSDIDIAIVSPSLYRRLEELRVPRREGGWIGPLDNDQLKALDLPQVVPGTINGVERGASIMIYPNRRILQSRGPWMPLGE